MQSCDENLCWLDVDVDVVGTNYYQKYVLAIRK